MEKKKKKIPVQKKVRLNLDLTPSVKGQLEALQSKTEASSLVEVIRRSLAVYDLVIEHEESGGAIYFEERDGSKERVRILH